MEIEAYLERIGAEMPDAPSLAALSTLHQKHIYAVPFDNLDVCRGVRMTTDVASILDKIVRRRRGGMCVESNTAFAWLLRKLGYRVSIVSGDAARGPDSFDMAGHHMVLLVDLGPDVPAYVADVGVRDGSIYPLPLVPDVITEDRSFRYRMVVTGDYWLVQRASGGSDTFRPVYRFTTTPRPSAHFDAVLDWVQDAPESIWRKINCFRVTPEGRVQIFVNRLIVVQGGQRKETWIRGEAGANHALRRYFGITLPPAPG